MQVYKTFFKIAKKRWKSATIYFIIYFTLTLMLSGNAKDTFTGYFQSTQLSVSLTDADNSTASEALCSYLSSLHNVTRTDNEPEAVLDQIYYRTLDYAVTIPRGFEERLLSGETDGLLSSLAIPASTRGAYVDQQISQYLQAIQLHLAGGFTLAEAIEQTDAALASLPETEVISFREEATHTPDAFFYFFQFFPYIMILILCTGMAPILVVLNKRDIRERTACSALPGLTHTLALAAGCTSYSFIIWILLLLLGLPRYGNAMLQPDALYAVVNSFAFLLFSAALALFISCFAPDDNIANMIANVLGLSMSFLCGSFVPQSMLPDAVLSAARFLPAYWYIRANNMLAGFGREVFDSGFYWQCIGIQMLFAAAVFALVPVVTKQRRRQA